MPLTRYQARNEYGLADPDLYQAADKDDPEALLEGVAMAGLVGILRQLGDLAEFAAEMFHDLHEEVMATAARSHGMMARVQQLEADFPSIEKALLCQTDHSPFFSYKGVEWHPNLQLEQSVITRGDLPRCVMDSYEECRGPPRLFLLDKFDISGAGACLKRYTDPSFVRHEISSYEASWDDIQREKKSQKAKRRASHWRNGGTPENALTSHAKLHELFMEEHLEVHHSDPARVVKLKTRKLDGYSLISKSGESYMEKFVQTSVDDKTAYELVTPNPGLLTWNMDNSRDVVTEIPENSMVGAAERSNGGSRVKISYVGSIEKDIETVPESTHDEVPYTTTAKDLQINSNGKPGGLQHSYSEDLTSEADNFVDAPATMESETETDDECRPKNRSGALKDGNLHTYSDVDEQRIEDQPRFSFFHSNENTPVSENEQSSFGKRSTSVSFSDTASLSIDDQSDGEKFSGGLSSTNSFKNELVDSTSHVTPEANKVSHDFNVPESVSSSNVYGQTSISSKDTCSSSRPVFQNGESCSSSPRPVFQNGESCSPPEVVENSPEFVRLDSIKGDNDESKVKPIDSSISGASFDVKNSNCPSETSSICSTSEGSRGDTTSEKNYVADYSSDLVNSGITPQAFVESQTGEQLPVADNDNETNSSVAGSESLASPGSDPKSCDGSLTGELLPSSAGMGVEVSPDMSSKVCDPSTVDEIQVKDTLDDETDCVTVTNAVAGVDSQSSVAEISEDTLENGTTADVSVSESQENTLENGMSMPAEVDSKVTSDVNSGGEKLVGDASSTCSESDEHISDIPAELHSSYLHDEGFHDLPELDNADTDIVSKVELDVSDNHVDTYSDDVNHINPSSCSLPWISTNSYQSSSEAGEICHDTVVESNRALPAENNLESEEKMKKSSLEVSSEGLGTALDNYVLESCESLSPMPSLDRSDRDRETRSPCTSSLVDNCIDPSPVNNLNLLESVTIEESVKAQTPRSGHAFANDELLQSSICGELVSAPQSPGLPQSAGIELNSPMTALNLDPTFPSFGSIPEITSPNQEEMPPLPPLPPMQWRIGKAQHSFFPSFMGGPVETSSSPSSVAPPVSSSLNIQTGFEPSELSASLESDKTEQLPGEFVNNSSEELLQSSIEFPTTGIDSNSQNDTIGSQITQSAYLSAKVPTIPNQGNIGESGPKENNLLADQAAKSHELVHSQESSLQLPEDPSVKDEDSQSSQGHHHCPETEVLTPTQAAVVENKGHYHPEASNAETGESSNSSVEKISVGDAMWPVNAFTIAPTLETKIPEEIPVVRLPRPRSPLVDAVAAHDRRTMKKVSERVQPPIKSKQDDKNSWLAQIRNKSVNLKPAVVTRPSIQTGPKTNLRVAAILEKANTIRQAMAGSDEDEDSDGWSDS